MPCYVCGDEISPDELVKGDSSDGLVPHHIDMNRANADVDNVAICHRGCHRAFHNAYEKGEDIRDKRAIKFWGATPKVKSCKSRRTGTLLTHRRSKR